jgi:hypothetical protein
VLRPSLPAVAVECSPANGPPGPIDRHVLYDQHRFPRLVKVLPQNIQRSLMMKAAFIPSPPSSGTEMLRPPLPAVAVGCSPAMALPSAHMAIIGHRHPLLLLLLDLVARVAVVGVVVGVAAIVGNLDTCVARVRFVVDRYYNLPRTE